MKYFFLLVAAAVAHAKTTSSECKLELSPALQRDFPRCEQQMQTLLDEWENQGPLFEHLKQRGVDESLCSIQEYLYGEGFICPRPYHFSECSRKQNYRCKEEFQGSKCCKVSKPAPFSQLSVDQEVCYNPQSFFCANGTTLCRPDQGVCGDECFDYASRECVGGRIVKKERCHLPAEHICSPIEPVKTIAGGGACAGPFNEDFPMCASMIQCFIQQDGWGGRQLLRSLGARGGEDSACMIQQHLNELCEDICPPVPGLQEPEQRARQGKQKTGGVSSQDEQREGLRGEPAPAQTLTLEANERDAVSMDVPLLIRLLELSREEIATDRDLHVIASRLVSLKNQGILSMDHYDSIIAPLEQQGMAEEQDSVPTLLQRMRDHGDDGGPQLAALLGVGARPSVPLNKIGGN